ncbi:alpha/beta hydrolase [Sphingomonas sp. UYP23]
MTENYHQEHLRDRAAMLAMRTMIALQPAPAFAPSGRQAFDDLMSKTPSADDVAYVSAHVGGIAGYWCRPVDAQPGAALLYLHGGAYVLGSAKAYCNFAGQIAKRAGMATFVPDYGLAPEQPFPSAINDAEAAYRGLVSDGFSQIAIAGDSAGGGLALATAARMTRAAVDEGVLKPCAIAVMSPWTDLTVTGNSVMSRGDHDPLLNRTVLIQAATLYLRSAEATMPAASPLYGELMDMPPVQLHVGEDEILLDDARRYANKLSEAGGLADLHVWEGMLHVFPANVALLKAAREALDLVGAFLNRYSVRAAHHPLEQSHD